MKSGLMLIILNCILLVLAVCFFISPVELNEQPWLTIVPFVWVLGYATVFLTGIREIAKYKVHPESERDSLDVTAELVAKLCCLTVFAFLAPAVDLGILPVIFCAMLTVSCIHTYLGDRTIQRDPFFTVSYHKPSAINEFSYSRMNAIITWASYVGMFGCCLAFLGFV